MIQSSPHNVRIDEKYGVTVNNGEVVLTRGGDSWLRNPDASKAWISVAHRLEELENELEELQSLIEKQSSTLTVKEFKEVAELIQERICEMWALPTSDPEAEELAKNLAGVIHLATRNTKIDPVDLIFSLISKY